MTLTTHMYLLRWFTWYMVIMNMNTPILAVGDVGIQWKYQEILDRGKVCPERDSCSSEGRSSQSAGELSWKSRNCFCDKDCSLYGDCCIDAETFDHNEQKDNFHSFSCLSLKQYGLVYMRTKCSPDWPEGHIRTACEDEASSRGDPVGSLPVTSIITGITYNNYYCAVCNQDSIGGHFWQPRFECPSLHGYNTRFGNITDHFIRDNLKYNEERSQWGVELETLGNPMFHACYIDPYLPHQMTPHLRPCPAQHLTYTCPEEYPDKRVAQLCQSYTGLVYSWASQDTFRNSHCALCNKVDKNSLLCIRMEGRSGRNSFGNTFQSFSFAVLFDINSSGGGEVGVENRCSDTDIWDPFSSKCRNVVCGEEGQHFVGGKCYQAGKVPEEATSTIATTVIKSLATTSSSSATNSMYPSTTTSTRTSPLTTTTTTITTRPKQTTNDLSPSIRTTIKPSLSVLDETKTLFSTETPLPPDLINITTGKPLQPNTPTSTSLNTSTSLLRTCPKFLLSPQEFQHQNDSVYVSAYRMTFPPGHFWLSGQNVYICQPAHTFSGVAKFSPIMGYVTMACLMLSIFCLTLHLVISCIAPQLQNLSGKNLSSLSLALVGANTLFLFNMFLREISTSSCFIMAVFMYYFYMAAFFWMLNIAFDVAMSLKQATVDLRVASGPQWGKFFLYSLVGWLIPALIVSCTIVIDLIDNNDISEFYKPGFGGSNIGLCWFSRRSALLIYFVIPFFVIMVLNIFFFLFSALLVHNSMKSSAEMTTSGPKINFFLYLRLIILMGLSWTSGLVAGWLDIDPIWYVFLVLNTLQGLFILVFFSCTKKILKSVKNRVCGVSKDDTWKSQSQDSEVLGGSPFCSTLKTTKSKMSAFTADGVEF